MGKKKKSNKKVEERRKARREKYPMQYKSKEPTQSTTG